MTRFMGSFSALVYVVFINENVILKYYNFFQISLSRHSLINNYMPTNLQKIIFFNKLNRYFIIYF